ncbi:MAG: Meiotic Sister-Chromatid recombination aldehyde dehydrogenase [Chaenotheca gracillima]|nr:MAG: Meiotic Sister-Chromatid recombination aldehyde dehydrogenase [Chaenotheca gracillima]
MDDNRSTLSDPEKEKEDKSVSLHEERDAEKHPQSDKELTGLRPESRQSSHQTDPELGLDKTTSKAASKAEVAFTPIVELSESDPNVVGWDGEDDPKNPLNWPFRIRWGHIAIISAITFVTPLASSMFAPGVPELMVEFDSTNELLASFVVSVYVLGFALGPLLIAPLSELYGRLYVYHVCNVFFIIFTVACALATNLNMLIGFRFLEGCFGAAPLTIGGGTIADLIVQEQRGGAMAIFAMGPLLGPVIGPVIGGYLSEAKGWRWVFWLLALISGVVTISALVFMRETYPITLLKRKAARLRKSTGNQQLRSKLDTGIPPRELFARSIVRPAKMLLFSPIVLLLSLFMTVVYGYLYLLFTTFPLVFQEQYGFSTGSVGLAYIGIGVGCLLGLAACGVASDKIMKAKSSKGEMKPEYRLPPMIYGAPLIPIGLFWYGWSAQAKAHWIVPIIGSLFVGAGMLAIFVRTYTLSPPRLAVSTASLQETNRFQMPVQTYMVDAFTVYAASALAANTVLRSTGGALLPLAGQKMYKALGLGWGNSLLGFIALAMCPIPWVFYKYGERIRKRYVLEL